MSDTLFDTTLLNWYRASITTKLAGHRIMTRIEYVKFMKPDNTFLNLYALIEKTKDLCAGVLEYAKSCLTACVIGDKECMKYNSLFLVSDDKTTVGFVIIQKGECKDRPQTISIKLICSNFKGGGHILLGAVACCIKKSLFKQEIILDLAGGAIENKIAYNSYKKFGFSDQPGLRTETCYPLIDTNNLVMLLDLSNLSCVDIVRIVRLPSGWTWGKDGDGMYYVYNEMAYREHPITEPEPEEPEPKPETKLKGVKRNRNSNENCEIEEKRMAGGKRMTGKRMTAKRTKRKRKHKKKSKKCSFNSII
jgi:hypothetical protein